MCERVKDYKEVAPVPAQGHSVEQARRCMDCGVPFCHWGCPVSNRIPEWNDAVFRKNWKRAFELLEETNIWPEITGRICPAPCEYACVLGINDDPVTIRENELSIIEQAFRRGYVRPRPPKKRTGTNVAVVGSGPAGLSCAAALNRAGHRVTVFERDDSIGGIMRYGIPDFKLDKSVLDRRIALFKEEGVMFKTGVCAGETYTAAKLKKNFDAVCLAGGSRVPRDLAVEGRDLDGIHFAMDYLIEANRRAQSGKKIQPKPSIDAAGRRVVVIGGGDTGSDCVGTAHRQGASCVVQIEIMPRPAECRTPGYPWPTYPLLLKTSTSHEEGGTRDWSVKTVKFEGPCGRVSKLRCVRVEVGRDEKQCMVMRDIPGSAFEIEADMVILALGFMHPEKKGLLEDLGVMLDQRGNVATGPDFMTSRKGIFAAGDMRRGQSLIVWAIAEGRRSAHYIDTFLTGSSSIPLV